MGVQTKYPEVNTVDIDKPAILALNPEATLQEKHDYYMSLPYTYQYIQEDDGSWFVRVLELPGCMSTGDTIEEAFEMIRDAQRGWIEVGLEMGHEIPKPETLDSFSGKFNVRIPKSLHRDAVRAAEAEGVSLNQFVNVAIARAVASTG